MSTHWSNSLLKYSQSVVSVTEEIIQERNALKGRMDAGVPEGWQPIETAPKGIDWILLGYFPDYMEGKQQGGKPEVAYWNDTTWMSTCGMKLRHDGMFSPTHWMPLPNAPKPTEGKPK